MITTFTLIRHGETDWNKKGIVQGVSNIPLNDHGIKQAYEKAAFFENKEYDLAYSSPLTRACQTMEIILQENEFDLPIHTDERLRERCFGEAEGIHYMYHRSFQNSKTLPKGFEKNEVLEKRLYQFLEEKIQAQPGKSFLITAHSHVLKATHRAVHQPKIDYSYPLANLGVLVIQYNHDDETWNIPYYEGENK